MTTRYDDAKSWIAHSEVRRRDFVYAALAIIVATLAAYVWVMLWGLGNLTLIFFGAVLFTGFRFGMWPALFSGFLAFLSYNFFFEEPRFEFTITLDDVLALFSFLVGGLLVGGLTGRLADRARELNRALGNVSSLFDASRDLSMAIDPPDAVVRVLSHIQASGARAAIWLVQGGRPQLVATSENASAIDVEAVAKDAVLTAASDAVTPQRAVLRLHAGTVDLGVAVVWVDAQQAMPDIRWLRALLELAAVAIDRARLIGEIAETQIVMEKEGLRTALLSSLSHDLRTPIATILASTTSLQEYGSKFDEQTRGDLLSTIQDESERLNRYVANLLAMTRLESGAIDVGRALIDPGEAMATALRHTKRRWSGQRVVREFAADGKRIDVNAVLLEQALMNIIENAADHSPENSTIYARVQARGDRILMEIEDEGAGIAPENLVQVFEKFFRGGGDRRRGSGVGLGLSVARGLIEAFGGVVRAVSPARDGKGTCIEIELPAHQALETVE